MRGIAKLKTLLAQRESKFPYDRVIGSSGRRVSEKQNQKQHDNHRGHKGTQKKAKWRDRKRLNAER